MNTQHLDDWCEHFYCGDCKHYKHPYDGGCQKRIDHKRVKFAKPWFKSYDGNQHSGNPCSDFVPSALHVCGLRRWTTFDDYWLLYVRDWLPYSNTDVLTYFTIGDDTSIRYGVRLLDFVYGNMFDGAILKAVEKMYYKRRNRTKENSFGYELIREKIDGVEVCT